MMLMMLRLHSTFFFFFFITDACFLCCIYHPSVLIDLCMCLCVQVFLQFDLTSGQRASTVMDFKVAHPLLIYNTAVK